MISLSPPTICNSAILVSPAVVQGAPDVTRNIQHDIARRMKGEQ
jgi:hypothetical protein